MNLLHTVLPLLRTPCTRHIQRGKAILRRKKLRRPLLNLTLPLRIMALGTMLQVTMNLLHHRAIRMLDYLPTCALHHTSLLKEMHSCHCGRGYYTVLPQ
jgi:hypothetical protein